MFSSVIPILAFSHMNIDLHGSLCIAIRVEVFGAAIVYWGNVDEKEINKDINPEDIKGDCNKEQYYQKVVLLETGES